MQLTFEIIVWIHIIVGSIGLTSFWIPVFARKGRGTHTRVGRIFAYAMLATATTAGCAALLTLAFPLATHPDVSSRYESNLRAINGLMLLYLAAITFHSAFAGLRAVRLKRSYGGHRARRDLISGAVSFLLAAAVLWVGIRTDSMLMIGLSMIGLIGVPGDLRLILRKPESPLAWKYHHMSSMLGAGIAAHTAFLVFGAGRFVDSSLGNSVWVWLAPTLVGVPATTLWRRYLQRRESVSSARVTAAGKLEASA